MRIDGKVLDNLMLSQIKNPITDDTNTFSNANCIRNYGNLYIKHIVPSSSLLLRNTSSILASLASSLVLDNDNNVMSNKYTPGMLVTRTYITKCSKYFTTPDFNSLIIKPERRGNRNNQLCRDVLWISMHGFLGGFMNPDEIAFILESVIHAIPNEFQEFMDDSNAFSICPVLEDYFMVYRGSCEFIDQYKQFSSMIAASNKSTASQQSLQEHEKSIPVETPNMDYPRKPNYSTLPFSFTPSPSFAKDMAQDTEYYTPLIKHLIQG